MKEIQKSRNLRMDDSRWLKLRRLGGAEWLRGIIDKAKEPATKPTKE